MVSVILPTYNERENIVPLIRRLKGVLAGTPKEIIVVDDNSPDGTARQVRDAFAGDAEVNLIVRHKDRGLAKSIREGVEYATGEVFTARRAQELGLVDDLGDAETAQELAAQLGGVPRRLIYVRPRRPFLRRVFRGVAQELAGELMEEAETRLYGRMMYR